MRPRLTPYHIGIFLSSTSMGFGILREILIVGLLGFTVKNDTLQIYLSIFYTIGLTIDAMRLSCLILFDKLTLTRIILSASFIGLPFSIIVGLLMSYSTGGLNSQLLAMTIAGSYLNLIAALLITYKQRNNAFLSAQIINVMPNFILIPGILLCYLYAYQNMIFAIVALTSLIPVVQCILLLFIPTPAVYTPKNAISLYASSLTFLRHFSAMIGEQLFQIITRTAFFNYGTGYLSLFTMVVRLYSALRFILIDSYIGSKLFSWGNDKFGKLINSTMLGCAMALAALLICLKTGNTLTQVCIQIGGLLIFGFYFATLVRIVYFKINRYENNASIVLRFALYELLFALFAFMITQEKHYPLLILLWIGYIAKPYTQLLLLRKKFVTLEVSLEA